MALAQPLVGHTDLSTRGLVGSLDGGYFVTTDLTTGLELRSVTDPATIVDTVTLPYNIWTQLQDDAYGGQDALGHLYALQAGTAAFADLPLLSITQAGGALTVGTVATVTYHGFDLLWVSNDGAEVILQDGNDVYAYDSSTGASNWTMDTAGVLGFGYVCGFPAASRMVYENQSLTPDLYQLVDDTGTVLDTAALTISADSYADGRCGDDGAGITITVMDADNTTLYYNVLDSAGDSLTWVYGSNQTITTGWGQGEVKVSGWQDKVVLTSYRGTGAFPDQNLIWLLPRTGESAMVSSAYLNRGADAPRLAGYNATVVAPSTSGTDWSTWLSVTAPTYLRQRQSPVRAPSRVRPAQLRQRQRPEI